MWEAGRRLLAAIVIGSKFSVYGVVGAFVAIMLWVFYAVTILFLGAEYIQVFCARCSPPAQANPDDG
jgi:membrane protein